MASEILQTFWKLPNRDDSNEICAKVGTPPFIANCFKSKDEVTGFRLEGLTIDAWGAIDDLMKLLRPM